MASTPEWIIAEQARRDGAQSPGTRSVVMLASTDLVSGASGQFDSDAQVQITATPGGEAFVSVHGPDGKHVYVRIAAAEWQRFTDETREG